MYCSAQENSLLKLKDIIISKLPTDVILFIFTTFHYYFVFLTHLSLGKVIDLIPFNLLTKIFCQIAYCKKIPYFPETEKDSFLESES